MHEKKKCRVVAAQQMYDESALQLVPEVEPLYITERYRQPAQVGVRFYVLGIRKGE